MLEITTLLKEFYDFVVFGITEYLFVFNLHYILAYITILIGIKYTNNFKWYEKLLSKFKISVVPFTGILLMIAYSFLGTDGMTISALVSVLQSFILTLSLQDVFIVLFSYLINKLTFGLIKFDHKNKSINYVKVKKDSENIELNKKD